MFGLQLPLTRKPLNNPFEPLQIKWEVNIFYKEVFLRLCHCVRLYYCVSIYMYDAAWTCIWECNTQFSCFKSLKSIESSWECALTFNGNPCTTIMSYNSQTNTSDETDIATLYNELFSLAWHIPNHNVLIIIGDMNTQIDKEGNHKFCLHNLPKTNGKFWAEFSFGNRLACLNIKFPKSKGRLCTNTYPYNAQAHLDYILINKKWMNSTLNYETFSTFKGVSSDQRIISAMIRRSLCRNRKQ